MLKLSWRDELEINTKDWDKICKYFPTNSLFDSIMPKLLGYINRRDESSKIQEIEKLKRKLKGISNNFRSSLTEIFWFTHLYDNNFKVTIVGNQGRFSFY
jgi:hypothetical protein